VRCVALGALGASLSSNVGGPHANEVVDEFVREARVLGDPYLLWEALSLRTGADRPPEFALAESEEALRLARETGSPSCLAFALMLLAPLIIATDPERARSSLEEAVSYASEVHHQFATDFALQILSRVQSAEGDFVGAAETLVTAFDHARQVGDRSSQAQILRILCGLLVEVGADDDALTLETWISRHAFAPDPTESAGDDHRPRGEAADVLLARTTDAQQVTAARRAASLSDVELVALAHAAIVARREQG
jgi:hypothetical protein